MNSTPPMETEAGWHDDLIYALRLEAADPDAGDWRSNLVLDIDHIVEWVCGAGGRPMFKVAPATLAFHDVGGLRVDIDFAKSGFSDNILELAIDSISKIQSPPPGADPTRPYWRWRIALNLPKGGEITFGASGYTLSLRADPRLVSEQRLPLNTRPRFPAV
jgi:hypothetical protein